MQRLRVEKWCDLCFHEREQYVVSTSNYTISVSSSGKKPLIRLVDVCDEHDSAIQGFRALILKVGSTRRPTDQSAEPTEVDDGPPDPVKAVPDKSHSRPGICPECGLTLKRAVPTHLMRTHGYAPIKQPARCPDCTFIGKGDAAMHTHRVKIHGYDQVADMVAIHQQKRGRK